MSTNLIFFGCDRFSAVVLKQLINQNYTPSLVITDSPKPLGRHKIVTPNDVEKIANEHSIKVCFYLTNNEELINYINTNHPTGLSASFPHLFSPQLIKAFAEKLFNLHPSLLPQYRNVAPGPYAIAMGDSITGITLFPIGIGIDNGEILAQQNEAIQSTDTTTSLLTRLFTIGTQLFLKYLKAPSDPTLTTNIPVFRSSELVFTRKLTRESGYVEWEIVQRLLQGLALKAGETVNPLINLRLTHHPERTNNILPDLIRALDGYEKVWTISPTKKGELTISLSLSRNQELMVLIPGKPNSINWNDFDRYYLE